MIASMSLGLLLRHHWLPRGGLEGQESNSMGPSLESETVSC